MTHGIDDNFLVCENCGEWHDPEHGIICDSCGDCVDLEWANACINDSEELIASQAARIAELEDVINLGLFAMFIPAIRDIRQRQLESGQSPIADFEEAARDLLAKMG